MNTNEKHVSFPAEKHGWGWGLLCRGQGWVVYAVWAALLCVGGIFLAPRSIGLYVLYAIALGIAFYVVVFIKGERPHWRWGKDLLRFWGYHNL